MSVSFVQANTNGRLHPATEPSLSPLNRGFLYGDAIYEVWRTYHGTIFAWEEHFTRLEASARALYFTVPFSRAEILREIARTVAAFREATGHGDDLYIRLQLSRGGGPIGLDVALAERPEFVLLVQPCPALPERQRREGLKLSIARDLRRNPIESLSPAWKTGNYLNNILGLREARARGADDVLMLNLGGELTEASTSNIGFVQDGAVITPPLPAGILAGVTRRLLLEIVAGRIGVAVREAAVRVEDLARMQECFVLGSTRDLVPVAAIDEVKFTVAENSLTARLKRAFEGYTHEYAAAHPELKV